MKLLDRIKVSLGNSPGLERFCGSYAAPAAGDSIAVHLPNHLGDNVMAIPLVHSLVRYGRFDVTLLSLAEHLPLWRALGYPLRLVELPRVRARTFGRALRTLRELRISHSILLATGEEIAWLHLRAGVRNRIGYDFWGRGCLLTKRLVSDGKPTSERLIASPMHENYLAILEAMSIPTEVPDSPWLKANPGAETETRPVLAISPLSNRPERALPAPLLATVLERVSSSMEIRALLLGKEPHPDVVRELGSRGIESEDLGGLTCVAGLIDRISKARAFLGPDSGSAHIAAALGVPCVSVFTSGASSWTTPSGPRVRAVGSRVECAPCFGEYTCRGSFRCREDLNADSIAEALLDLLLTRA